MDLKVPRFGVEYKYHKFTNGESERFLFYLIIHGDVINQIQTVGNSIVQMTQCAQQQQQNAKRNE